MSWNKQITSSYFHISVTKPGTGFTEVDKGRPGPCPQGAYNLVTQTGIHQLMKSIITVTRKKKRHLRQRVSVIQEELRQSEVWVLHL